MMMHVCPRLFRMKILKRTEWGKFTGLEVVVGLVHFFVTLCLCGSLLGSTHLLLGSLSTFVDQDGWKWAEWSQPSSWINAWNGDDLGRMGLGILVQFDCGLWNVLVGWWMVLWHGHFRAWLGFVPFIVQYCELF